MGNKKSVLFTLGLVGAWAGVAGLVMGVTEVYATSAAPEGVEVLEDGSWKLGADVETASQVEVDSDLVIDLNGHKMAGGGAYGVYVSAGEVVLRDNVGGGEVSAKTPVYVAEGAKVVMESGKISGTSKAVENYGEFVLEDGEVVSTSYGVGNFYGARAVMNGGEISSRYAGISGNNTIGDQYVEVNGGKIKATGSVAIYMPNQVSLKISGGEILGGVLLKMGQVEISGGRIVGSNGYKFTDTAQMYTYSGMAPFSGAVSALAGAYTSENVEFGNSLSLKISGGELVSGKVGVPAVEVYDAGKVEQEINVEISGGVFTAEGVEAILMQDLVEAGFEEESLAKGYGVVKNNITGVVSGGRFTTAPEEEAILGGMEAENVGTEEEPMYEILPKEVMLQGLGVGNEEGEVRIEFSEAQKMDRKAGLTIEKVEDAEIFSLDLGMFRALDIKVKDRNGTVEISNTEMEISVKLEEEERGFDKYTVVYIDNGEVKEKIPAEVDEEGYLKFSTTHLSVYGIVGENEEVVIPKTPNTGRK